MPTQSEFDGFLGRMAAPFPEPTRTERLDRVVISGAGPTGLTAALTLARLGVPVTVIEKLDGLSGESRASTFHPPTLELLDELGVAAQVVADGLIAPTTQFRDRQHGPVATFDLGALAGETSFPFRVQLEQSKLTPMLLAALMAGHKDGSLDVEVRFSHRAHWAETLDNGAAVLVGTPKELVRIEAPWVIAAEGAHSGIRTGLGIEMEGEIYPERFLVVSVAEELSDHISDLAFVNYVADPSEWLVLLRTPDHWRLLFPIPDAAGTDQEVCVPEFVQSRLDGVVNLGRDWEVLATSIYVVARRAAQRFREGRILLAGDAAHQNSPLGGMGMNSGIQDAVSAGRRLASVWGGASEDVLDEYAQLRREVAVEHVQADSHANWLVLREPDPDTRATYQRELQEIAADPVRHAERMRRSAMLESVRNHL